MLAGIEASLSRRSEVAMSAAQALLHGAIDYAGLFPPAGLDLETTVENYARYRSGQDTWGLGRLVLPATKLAEFADRWPQYVEAWPVSLLLGGDYDSEMRLAVDVGLPLSVVECRPLQLHDVTEIRRRMPGGSMLFVENPTTMPVLESVTPIAEAGACAKLRMGGVTANAIPATGPVAAFLVACAQRGMRLKATAGLHHAVRGEYRLTYDPRSASACMHGFVNFFLAATAAYNNAHEDIVVAILEDGDRSHFSAIAGGIRWCNESFSTEAIQRMRRQFAISFGSCSFEEPMEEMRSMGWIE